MLCLHPLSKMSLFFSTACHTYTHKHPHHRRCDWKVQVNQSLSTVTDHRKQAADHAGTLSGHTCCSGHFRNLNILTKPVFCHLPAISKQEAQICCQSNRSDCQKELQILIMCSIKHLPGRPDHILHKGLGCHDSKGIRSKTKQLMHKRECCIQFQ